MIDIKETKLRNVLFGAESVAARKLVSTRRIREMNGGRTACGI